MTKKNSKSKAKPKADEPMDDVFSDITEEEVQEAGSSLPETGMGLESEGILTAPAPLIESDDPEAAEEAKLREEVAAEVTEKLMKRREHSRRESAHRKWCRTNWKRRWVVVVNSNISGHQRFDFTIPHPDDPHKPVQVSGQCGVILEDGLNSFAIARLREAYHVEMRDAPLRDSASGAFVLEKVPQIVKDYTVEVMEEVKDPKPIGFSAKSTRKRGPRAIG